MTSQGSVGEQWGGNDGANIDIMGVVAMTATGQAARRTVQPRDTVVVGVIGFKCRKVPTVVFLAKQF